MLMLKKSGLIIAIILLSCCNNPRNIKNEDTSEPRNINRTKNTVQKDINAETPDKTFQSDTPEALQFDILVDTVPFTTDDKLAIWTYNIDLDSIIQIKKLNPDTLTAQKLISLINNRFQNRILINLSKINKDTLFLEIKNPHYLTQQIGSSGALDFMISSTYTLTELNGIEFVSFNFIEGNHASPGTYSRDYYTKWIKNNRKINKR